MLQPRGIMILEYMFGVYPLESHQKRKTLLQNQRGGLNSSPSHQKNANYPYPQVMQLLYQLAHAAPPHIHHRPA